MAKSEPQMSAQPAIQPTNADPTRFSCAISTSLMPASARISVQPGPAGFTFWQKLIRVARSVCGPT